MTERQEDRQATTNEARRDAGLSTADMAAAAERSEAEGERGLKQMRTDAVPVESQSKVPTMANTGQQTAPQPTSLLATDEMDAFRAHWDSIQTGFVDEPRRSVEQADTLVAEVMKRLAETFANERANLEGQWSRGDDVSTEDLRVALQRYRSFFDRLLSM